MLELEQLKRLHDKAYNAGQVTRERASDDLVFYFVTQWDDNLLAESQLAYRGEFNMLKKAGRHILSDLAENPVQVDFHPVDEDRDDASEIADGLYRSDDAVNTSIESYENGKQESVVCGVGAWKLYTKYKTMRSGDKRQIIKRKPIFEACNTVFWDPNARFLDKSDSDYVSVLSAYSEDGYKKLVKDLTGEELDTINMDSFKNPEQSYTFPWIGGEGKKIYIVEFYHRELKKEKILFMSDPFGQVIELRETELTDVMDDMIDSGFEIQDEKEVDRYVVTKYIASGSEILSSDRVAGEHIPIVPIYGEHAYVEGEEHYEGITRLSKDPQRLRNFIMSYIADIVSRSPRRKPIFFSEQIRGFEHMYQDSGADNNFPYLYQNRKSPTGEDLPIGPVGEMPDQPMPSALPPMLQYASDAIRDVADPGVPQDISDPDVSGKAVLALQARLDMQSAIYQLHFKHSKRRDAEIWASMASEIYDTPRKVTMTLPDGTRKQAEVMQAVIDQESGDVVFLNDLRSTEFEIISRIGPDYKTQRQQTVDMMMQLIPMYDPADPMRKALQLKAMQHIDGVDIDDLRKYARKQLVLSGIQEPETEEEQQMVLQAQQAGQQPSAEMVLAMAEDKKGQAALMREKREIAAMQLETQNELAKRQVDGFKAQTDRMEAQVKAQETGATINNKNIESFGKKLDNTEKMMNLRRMSNEDLLKLAGVG